LDGTTVTLTDHHGQNGEGDSINLSGSTMQLSTDPSDGPHIIITGEDGQSKLPSSAKSSTKFTEFNEISYMNEISRHDYSSSTGVHVSDRNGTSGS
jgi:hypothetical protein